MADSISALQAELSKLRDGALDFFVHAQFISAEDLKTKPEWSQYHSVKVWHLLPEELQKHSDKLRAELRPLMARLLGILRVSSFLGDADFRDFSRHAKIMDAALRLREFRQWGTYIHHDEDRVLGVDPPGQEETELDLVEQARELFVTSYKAVTEMMDYYSPRDEVGRLVAAERDNVRAYRPNTAFILMRINPEMPELNDVRETVEEVFKKYGVKAIRADEIEHEGVITERVLREIETAEFIFADLTGERPSVYYEVGYGHALGKRVMLYRKKGTKLHFDLAAYNCPEYDSLGDLRRKLESRLSTAMNRADREP